MFSLSDLSNLAGHYGYGVVALAVGVEGMGIPVPGETALLAAAIYAGTAHHLSIGLVVAAAVTGAVIGDNVGFWGGRSLGFRALLRYGPHVRLTEPRIKLGQYLFLRHGGKIAFAARFVPVLRAFGGWLAGANRMRWPRYALFDALGATAWATAYGLAAYGFGEEATRLMSRFGIVLVAAAAAVMAVGFILLKRREEQLQDVAERALPGPLRAGRNNDQDAIGA